MPGTHRQLIHRSLVSDDSRHRRIWCSMKKWPDSCQTGMCFLFDLSSHVWRPGSCVMCMYAILNKITQYPINRLSYIFRTFNSAFHLASEIFCIPVPHRCQSLLEWPLTTINWLKQGTGNIPQAVVPHFCLRFETISGTQLFQNRVYILYYPSSHPLPQPAVLYKNISMYSEMLHRVRGKTVDTLELICPSLNVSQLGLPRCTKRTTDLIHIGLFLPLPW